MSEVRLSWTGDRLQFVGRTGYGDVVTMGGDTGGPGAKPSDLLPISLAACTAYDVVVILHKQRQDLRGLEAVITSTATPRGPPGRSTSNGSSPARWIGTKPSGRSR